MLRGHPRHKIRDGQVTNRPVYTAIGVTVDGQRDILGLWIGSGGEGAKFWLQVLTEIRNRGTNDVCIVVCDGLSGLPNAVAATWPLTSSGDPTQWPMVTPPHPPGSAAAWVWP